MTEINITSISQWNDLAFDSTTTRINKNILISVNLFFEFCPLPLFLENNVIVNGQSFTIYYYNGIAGDGLFNFPSNGFGTIKNLNINPAQLSVNTNQSFLMYYNGTIGQYGTFENVHILNAKLTNTNTSFFFCSGFGNTVNKTTITKCSVNGATNMPLNSGGFINIIPTNSTFEFIQCNINNGSFVVFSGTNYGGFIYQNNGNVLFSKCASNYCTLNNFTSAYVRLNNGILSFDQCIVNGSAINSQFGGFVGQDIHGSNGNYITISNCYSLMESSGINPINEVSAFIGISKGCTITNSYGILKDIGIINSNVGIFVGIANGTNTFTNCYTLNGINRQGTPNLIQSLPSLETYQNTLPPNWLNTIWGISLYPLLKTFVDPNNNFWDGTYLSYDNFPTVFCRNLNNCFTAYPKFGFNGLDYGIDGQYNTRKHFLTVGQSWFKMYGNYTNKNNIQNIMIKYDSHNEFDISGFFTTSYDPLFRVIFICGSILNYFLNASFSWSSGSFNDIATYNYDSYVLSRNDLIKKYIFGNLIDNTVPSDPNYFNDNSTSITGTCLNKFSQPITNSLGSYDQTILDEMYRYACRKEVEQAIPQGFYNNVTSTFTNISVNNNWDRLIRYIFTPRLMLENLADNNGNNDPYISFLPNTVNPNFGDPFCVIKDGSNPNMVDQKFYYINLLRMQQFNIGSLLRQNFINTAMYYLYVSLKQILGYTETTFFKDISLPNRNLILLNMDRYYYYLSYVLFPMTTLIKVNNTVIDYVTNIYQIFKYTIDTTLPIPSFTTTSTGINILTPSDFKSIKDFEQRQPQFILIQGYSIGPTGLLQVNVLNYNGYTPWLVRPLTVEENNLPTPIPNIGNPAIYDIINHNNVIDTSSPYFNLNNISQSITNNALAQGFLKNSHTQFNTLYTRIFINGIDDLYFINPSPSVSNVQGTPIQILFSNPPPYLYLPFNPRYPYDIQTTLDSTAIQNLTAFTYKVPTSTLKINVSQVLVSSLTWTASTISLPSGSTITNGQRNLNESRSLMNNSIESRSNNKIKFSQKDMLIFMKRQILNKNIIGTTYCDLEPTDIANTSLNEYLLLRSTIDGYLVGLNESEVSFLLNIEYFDPTTISSNQDELKTWSKLVCVVILYRTYKILYPYLKSFYDININRTKFGKKPIFFSQTFEVIDNTLIPYSDLVNPEINNDIELKYKYFLQYSRFVF